MRHHHSHLYLFLLLVIPLIILVTYTANKVTKQTLQTRAQSFTTAATPTTTVIAKNLEIPWALDFLPDGNIIFTERPGRVKLLNPTSGQITTLATIQVKAQAESGLLGIVVHPNFATNNFVYLYYSYAGSGGTQNRVARYTLINNQLANATTLIDAIPGNDYHNGGRLRFGPDGFLYVTTGDGNNLANPQDTNSLGGKILRVKDDGTAAPGNPFNNRTWSYGHRNPQGIAWNGTTMYETEHGPSQPSCCDEINRIEAGKNYGWPDVTGDQTKEGTIKNLLNSGQDGNNTWAPSGTTFYNGSIFYAGLKGQALFEAKVSGDTATIVTQHFDNQFGRIRDVVIGPDNQLYITTSNKSAQGGSAQAEDDKIIKVSFGLAAPSQPAGVTPSFYPLAPCPTCVNPSVSPVTTSGAVIPSGSAVIPSTGLTNPTPIEDPCEAGASVAHTKKKSRHSHHDGDVSGFMELLLRFLMELLNLLLKLFGGGSINLPTPGPVDPQPENPVEPCVEPSEAPEPSEPVIEPSPVISVLPSAIISILPSTTLNPSQPVGQGTSANVKITFYGSYDNDPPGSKAIANPVKHQEAGGTGTYADPLTFASPAGTGAYTYGQIIYVPMVQKYFIREDECAVSHSAPDGCGAVTMVDLYVGNPSETAAVIACQESLTPSGNTQIIIDPPATLTVDPAPIWNQSTGKCMTPHN